MDLLLTYYHLTGTIVSGFEEEEKEEVEATVRSFYSAFNRKNYDEIRVLLLPCAETSCAYYNLFVLPSFLVSLIHLLLPACLHFLTQHDI
jgi:hypothetical protein